jgi:tetratricopeptide (TPR) repeat protein
MDHSTEQLLARAQEAVARSAYFAALEDLDEVARREPTFADVHNLIGLCRSLLGQPELALTAFERATELNPGYVEAHLNRAITLNDLGRYDEAREQFEQASDADEEKGGGPYPSALAARLANMHAQLGDLYAEGGALDEAVRQYRTAKEIRPRFIDIRNKLGRALIEHGALDEAVDELESILEINPGFIGARANLGLARYRSGDHGAAEAEWKRCLVQQPENAQVQSFLGMLRRAREA